MASISALWETFQTVALLGTGNFFLLLLQHPQVPVAIFLSPLLTLYLRMRFFLDWLVVAIISFFLD